MIRTPFNIGWTFGPKQNEFAELGSGASKTPVHLPHDALIGLPRSSNAPGGAPTGYFPDGVWEYSVTIDAPESWRDKTIAVEFEGVYRSAVVFLNGVRIAEQPNGYTGFIASLDAHLKFGQQNTITVEARTHADSRWYSGAGIYRPVHLLVADPVHFEIDGVRVRTPDVSAQSALIEIDTGVVNTTRHLVETTVETVVLDMAGSVVLTDSALVSVFPGERATLRQRMLLADPDLWSPDFPSLYQTKSRLLGQNGHLLDEAEETFGIRALQVDVEHGLRVNGETILLRGACIHHDNGVLGAATFGRAEERRVELLKQAGFNSLRASHQPMSRSMLEACDRLGMLVIDESFDMWTKAKTDFDYSLDFERCWEADLAAMVRKDRNHPSVIAYSIGNEIPELATPAGAAWARRLATRTRELDETRFVTSAINGALTVMPEVIAAAIEQAESDPSAFEGMGINTYLAQMAEQNNQIGASDLVTTRTAEAFATLDIAGMNYLDARYEQDRELFPHRVIVGSETFPTRIDVLWALVKRLPHVIGDFTWTGWDYLGEAGIGRTILENENITGIIAPYPWFVARSGDIDITGHRRPASYYREIVFGLSSTPYLAVQRPEHFGKKVISSPWAWSDSISSWTWPGYEKRPIRVEVYSDADEIELFQDERSLGRQTIGETHAYRAVFDTSYVPGELVAVAYVQGRETARTRLVTAAPAAVIAATPDREVIVFDDNELAFIDLEILDENGTLVTAAQATLTIDIDGPGTLAGFGSADPQTSESFTDASFTTFDGRALAVIRPSGTGTISVTVSSSDLPPAEVRIVVQSRSGKVSALLAD